MAKKQAPRRGKRQPGITSITYWRKFASHRFIYIGLAGIIGFGIIAYFGTSYSGDAGGMARQEYLQSAIATVNGEPLTRQEFDRQAEMIRRRSGSNPAMVATEEGMVLSSLIDGALLRAGAKRKKLSVSDADVEKSIREIRQVRQGAQSKPLTDEEVLQLTGTNSMSDLRDAVRRDLLPRQLGEFLSGSRRLTYADLEKSYDEADIRHILIGVTGAPRPSTGALPDAQAKAKAEKILAALRAGGDFAQLANENTTDPSNQPTKWDPKSSKMVPDGRPKGGSLGWYKRGGGFDKTFEDAAFALKAGQISGLVKTPFGYHIVKIEGLRRNLPKDYEKNKAQLLESLRQQKASEALQRFLAEERPKAQIVWKDRALEWRYAYAKASPYGGMGMQMPPSQGEQDKIVERLRAYVPKNKTDSAAALILGQLLYQKFIMSGLPAGIAPKDTPKVDRNKLRDEVLANYEIALEHTEDTQTRLTLARLYREAGKDKEALRHYRMISRLMSWDSGVETKATREQLEKALRELGDTALADQEASKLTEIKAKEEADRKAAAERAAKEKAKAAAEKAAKDAKAGTGGAASPKLPSGEIGTPDRKDGKTTVPASTGTIEFPVQGQPAPKKP